MKAEEILNKLTNKPWDRIEVYFVNKETLNIYYTAGSKQEVFHKGQYLSVFIKDNKSIRYSYNMKKPESSEDFSNLLPWPFNAYDYSADYTDYLANIPKRFVKTLY